MEAAVITLAMAVLKLEGISRMILPKSFVLCVWWGNTDILQLTMINTCTVAEPEPDSGLSPHSCLSLAPRCNPLAARRPEGLHQFSYPQSTEVTCAIAVCWMEAGIVALEKGDTFSGSQSLPWRSCQVDVGTPQIFTQQWEGTALTRIKKKVTFGPR